MKRKIENYLNAKGKSEYSNLDRIFELYLNGNLTKLLSKYAGVRIYPTMSKSVKTIQLEYHYNNIYTTVEFFEDKYNVVVYYVGISASDLEKLFIEYEYPTDFSLEKLIEEIDEKIKNHPELKDTTLIEKKKKKYSLIASISFCLTFLFIGIAILYWLITKKNFKGNGMLLIMSIVAYIVYFIFDLKSKRLK